MKQLWNSKKFLFTILLFLCIAGILRCMLISEKFTGEISIRYDRNAIMVRAIKQAVLDNGQNGSATESEASELQQEKRFALNSDPDYLLWNQQEDETIESNVTGATKQLSVVESYGNTELFLPMNIISGSPLQSEDETGCLIDQKTAFTLFGTVNSFGNSIFWKGKEYIVRGVLDTTEEFMLVINNDIQKSYSNLELIFRDKAASPSMKQPAKKFLTDASLSLECRMIDSSFLITMEQLLCLIPSILFCTILIFGWLPYSRMIRFLLCIASIVLLFILLQVPFTIPEDFIPNQWSDFAFYSEKYKEILSEINQFIHSRAMYKEIYLQKSIIQSFLYVITSILLLAVSSHYLIRMKKSL